MTPPGSEYIPYSGSSSDEGRGIFTRPRALIGLGVISGLSSFLILLFVSIWILSTFTEPMAINTTTSSPKVHSISTIPPPTPTHTPRAAAVPTPAPVSPFPLYLQQEVAALKNHDRFITQGNSQLPEIALTFDDGPSPAYTPQILTVLRQYEIQATFFCVGSLVQLHPELAKQEFTEGHTIGNHTWSHPNMPLLAGPSLIWQITTAQDTIERAVGARPTYFRPPYGAISADTLKYINIFGLTTVIWNTDPTDWKRPGVDAIINTVMRQAGNGAIILLHDGGGDRSQTVTALPIIINDLEELGYNFVTVPQLLKDMHVQPAQKNSQPVSTPGDPTRQHE